MAIVTLSLGIDSIQQQVRKAITELYANAESIRLVASAVEDSVGEVLVDAAPEQLRQVAAVVRSHTAFVLLNAVNLTNKAERLETIADIQEVSDEHATRSASAQTASERDTRSASEETSPSAAAPGESSEKPAAPA